MKKYLFFLLAVLVLFGCNIDDSLSSPERNVISENGDVPLEELILLINVQTSDSSYLVVESVDSIKIYVNDYLWSVTNSESLDTAGIVKYKSGNNYQTNRKLNYLVVAEPDFVKAEYLTAGGFAQYLNSLYELQPGEYACLVKSFQIRFNDQTVKTFYPYEYHIFKLEDNKQSVFAGEFQLTLN